MKVVVVWFQDGYTWIGRADGTRQCFLPGNRVGDVARTFMAGQS